MSEETGQSKQFLHTLSAYMKAVAVLIIFILPNCPSAFGQLTEQSLLNKDQVSVKSPNVASLGLFGEMPVSYFTGLPNIEVPLYTFSEGNISVPVKMSYHASGFRPDVHPGWVGMNWALSAGGVISRKVNGKADDYNTEDNYQSSQIMDPVDPYSQKSGYFFNRQYLDFNRWNQVSYLQELTGDNADMRVLGTRRDTEPDEFSFSFPGGSGKFYMAPDGNWKVLCDRAVTVTFNNQFIAVPFNTIKESIIQNFGYHKSFSGFTITDIDGTQYIYGGSSGLIEYSLDFIEQDSDSWQADSWYLKEIIEPSGKKVSFEYERGPFVNQMMMSLSQDFGTGSTGGGFWQPPCGISNGSFKENYSGRLIAPLYLTKIKGTTGSVGFKTSFSAELDYGLDKLSPSASSIARDIYGLIWSDFQHPNGNITNNRQYKKIFPFLYEYSENLFSGGYKTDAERNFRTLEYAKYYLSILAWYKLDTVVVSNASNQKIKSFVFNYDEHYNRRLSLNSIKEGDGEENFNPPYEFKYNPIAGDVPYFSGKTDHWGFYNGVLADISNLQNNPSIYYNSRSPNTAYAKMGMLNKIIYPTGGSTEFEYEGNSVGKRISLDRTTVENYSIDEPAGGLRIRKIKSFGFADESQNLEKEYFYTAQFSNVQGLPNSSGLSSGVLGGQILYLFKDFKVPANNSMTYVKNQFNSMSHLPGSNNSLGSPVGYSKVVERNKDKSYSIFYFKNFENGHPDESSPTINISTSPYGPYTSLENERGKLYREERFNSVNDTVYKKVTEYLALDKANQYVPAIRARSFNLCGMANYRYAEAKSYKNYTYAYLPSREIETKYDLAGANPITNIKNYTYNNNKLLKTESVTSSAMKSQVLENTYAFDMGNVQPYAEMVQKNIIAPIIIQKVSVNNVLQKTTKTEYSKNLSPNPALILPSTISTQFKTDNPEIRMTFNQYDDRGNILTLSKQGQKTCYIWGYAKNYPIAEIENAEYNTLQGALEFDLDMISNYIPSAGTIDISYDDILKPLRTYAGLKNAFITTRTYKPLFGMSSQTDLKGQTTYYEYDGFQRLKNVKDQNGNIIKNNIYYYKP